MKRKPPLITIALIFLTALLGIVSGPLGSAVEFPAALKPYAFPLFLILAIILSIIAVWQYFLQEKTEERTEHPAQLASPRDRQIIIARVRATWITGVLEQSLHGAALIALGLRDQPDVLANPLRLVLEEKDQSAQMLPVGTRITQVYDKAPSGLLILGEPGSGKTTMLLELARDLLSRAETDNNYPLPMIFNLSSWAVKQQPLAEWLVEEMNTMYQVSRRLGQAWVQADQVLLLLDGLDEVAPPHRAACVDAINAFREEHGLVNLVVCSRRADYLSLKQHVLVKSAVVVQPLTEQQIDVYLASAGEQLETVRVALRSDPVLQELATTPLMLSVLTLVYQGGSGKDLLTADSLVERRRKLFENYIHAMLRRRGGETCYTAKQTLSWLTWLARQLVQHSLIPFYLERMQPAWLPDTRSRFVYRVVVGLVGGLVGGLLFGLVGGLLFGLFGGLLFGLVGGLLFGLVGGLTEEIKPAEIIVWSRQSTLRGLVSGLLGGLLSGLPIGLFVGLVEGLAVQRMDQHSIVTPNQGIWLSARNGLRIGLIGGLLGGLFFGLFFGLVGVLGVLFFGLVGVPLVELVGVLFFGLFFGLLGVLLGGLFFGQRSGGMAFIQHFALRWILWRAGSMPWNYSRFLDYAAERILLRKVGGGYIFVHRLLLEHFVARDSSLSSS